MRQPKKQTDVASASSSLRKTKDDIATEKSSVM